MEAGAIAGIIVACIIVFLILLILCQSAYVVKQSEAVVIERFGRFHRILNSGLSFVAPFVDSPRKFPWQFTCIQPDGYISDFTRSDYRIDLREAVFHFAPMEVYTKDTILLEINSIMYYRISDIRKAIYEVDDLQNALTAAAQTQLKEVFGLMTFQEALECQEFINEHLVAEFSNLFEKWGVEVHRMEMLGLNPGRTEHQTTHAMKLQMIAERKRRGEFIRSEGHKAALNISAEGKKKEALTLGVAEQEAMRKISEGRAQATVMLATAEKAAMEVVTSSIGREGTSLMQYYLTNMYLDMFSQMSASGQFFLGYEPNMIMGLLYRRVPGAFGATPSARTILYKPICSDAPNVATEVLANLLGNDEKKEQGDSVTSRVSPVMNLLTSSDGASSKDQLAGLD